MTTAAPTIADALERLLRRTDLGREWARALGDDLMAGGLTGAQTGALLALWRAKGESVEELLGLVEAMREHGLQVEAQGQSVDNCGTGGDRLGTFNISTAAALVAAGAGAPVAKHGNRAISSGSGSADVLEALGVAIDLPPAAVATCIQEAGIGFMLAPRYHPGMRNVGATRRELGIRTVFNILGPLCNPARVRYQAMGVADAALAPKMAHVLAGLGHEHALVFSGPGGLDEIGLSGPSRCWEVRSGAVVEGEIDPASVGLHAADNGALLGGDARANAERVRAVLSGEEGPAADVVILNAAATLWAADRARDLGQGVEMARASVAGGGAARVLAALVRVSQKMAA